MDATIEKTIQTELDALGKKYDVSITLITVPKSDVVHFAHPTITKVPQEPTDFKSRLTVGWEQARTEEAIIRPISEWLDATAAKYALDMTAIISNNKGSVLRRPVLLALGFEVVKEMKRAKTREPKKEEELSPRSSQYRVRSSVLAMAIMGKFETPEELGKELGVTASTISQWTRNDPRIRLSCAMKLSKIFGTDVIYVDKPGEVKENGKATTGSSGDGKETAVGDDVEGRANNS